MRDEVIDVMPPTRCADPDRRTNVATSIPRVVGCVLAASTTAGAWAQAAQAIAGFDGLLDSMTIFGGATPTVNFRGHVYDSLNNRFNCGSEISEGLALVQTAPVRGGFQVLLPTYAPAWGVQGAPRQDDTLMLSSMVCGEEENERIWASSFNVMNENPRWIQCASIVEPPWGGFSAAESTQVAMIEPGTYTYRPHMVLMDMATRSSLDWAEFTMFAREVPPPGTPEPHLLLWTLNVKASGAGVPIASFWANPQKFGEMDFQSIEGWVVWYFSHRGEGRYENRILYHLFNATYTVAEPVVYEEGILTKVHRGECNMDFNEDGIPDQDDIIYLINAIAGGPNPTERDLDFNQDGAADQNDVIALIHAVALGRCP